jgi:hypothetical protein
VNGGRRFRRALLWRYLRDERLEYCNLWQLPEAGGGWALRGTAVFSYSGRPTEVRYRVVCDPSWRTRTVHVGVVSGEDKASLQLRVDDGRWFAGDREVSQYAGCVDVDLGIGASTNTLPIRRLGLEVGQAREIVAAWVRFPDLSLQPLAQRYTRLAERRYRYESIESGFTADLEVDDLGIVLVYPGWCEVVRPPRPTDAGPG